MDKCMDAGDYICRALERTTGFKRGDKRVKTRKTDN